MWKVNFKSSSFFYCFGETGYDNEFFGAIAQMGERLVCNQRVVGSIPTGSTILEREDKWNF